MASHAVTALCSLLFMLIASSMSHAEIQVDWVGKGPNAVGWRSGCEGANCFVTVPFVVEVAPQSIFQKMGECTNNEICQAAIVTAAAYVGFDPSTTISTLQLLDIALSGKNQGEAHFLTINAPDGYKACALYWDVKLNPPPGNARTPSVSGAIRNDREQVSFYSVVTQANLGGGGRSMEALVQIQFVKDGNYPPQAGCEKSIGQEPYGSIVFNLSGSSSVKQLRGGRHACLPTSNSAACMQP